MGAVRICGDSELRIHIYGWFSGEGYYNDALDVLDNTLDDFRQDLDNNLEDNGRF